MRAISHRQFRRVLIRDNRYLFEVDVDPVEVSSDSATLDWGRHLTLIRSCAWCHGEHYGGQVLRDEAFLGRVVAPNLTQGAGGVGARYEVVDWVRAIRHGIDPDGRPLMGMPSQPFYFLTDEDVGAIIAYLQSVEPVDTTLPPNEIGPLTRVAVALGQLQLDADLIDHSAPRPSVAAGVTVSYGEYLARDCMPCHGNDLAGQRTEGRWAPDLTSLGPTATWRDVDFMNAMRIGLAPGGRKIAKLPWQGPGRMTTDELRAIWMYLRSL